MLARPPHIVWRDAFGDELLMPAVVVELDQAVVDALDEAKTIEEIRVALAGIELRRLAERAADVADDIPPRRTVARRHHFVDGVVRVLEIGAVEQHQDDEQALI